jgi:hypothetical protein
MSPDHRDGEKTDGEKHQKEPCAGTSHAAIDHIDRTALPFCN